jgi:hypothetical protein
MSLKRSHSVKSNPSNYRGDRKTSWSGRVGDLSPGVVDKENRVFSEAEDEDDSNSGDETSEADTERRTSFSATAATTLSGTSGIYTDSLSYGTGSSVGSIGARSVSYASSTGGAIGGKTESITEEDEHEVEGENAGTQADHTPSDGYQNGQDGECGKMMALLGPASSALEAGESNSMALTILQAMGDISDLHPPRSVTGDVTKYSEASDSGLGTEPLSADENRMGSAPEYFERTQQAIASEL